MANRIGTTGALILWVPVCFTAFASVQYVTIAKSWLYTADETEKKEP